MTVQNAYDNSHDKRSSITKERDRGLKRSREKVQREKKTRNSQHVQYRCSLYTVSVLFAESFCVLFINERAPYRYSKCGSFPESRRLSHNSSRLLYNRYTVMIRYNVLYDMVCSGRSHLSNL